MSLDALITDPMGHFSFANVDRLQSAWGTHVYHHYPMRFIPQLARSLIVTYSCQGAVVADPFMGSGTTLVEARVLGRKSWGLDINPVAVLIAAAKITPLPPEDLQQVSQQFCHQLTSHLPDPLIPENRLERLLWWFPEENIKRLGILKRLIADLPADFQPFFTCAFSSILKQCSRWSPHSIKPIRSAKRHRVKIADPFAAIQAQLKVMEAGNAEFWRLTGSTPVTAEVYWGDARALPAADASVDLIVTSPPYVTAYDCTEVFELSILWLDEDPRELRQQVIGTRVIGGKAGLPEIPPGAPWREMVEQVYHRHRRSGVAAARYYQDMDTALREAVRVLRPGGHIALVTGNSILRGIPMPNASFFARMLESCGLRRVHWSERPVNGRSLPPVRDAATGRFLKAPRDGSVVAYRTETVMVYQKPEEGESDNGWVTEF